jgi:hypothetical protein
MAFLVSVRMNIDPCLMMIGEAITEIPGEHSKAIQPLQSNVGGCLPIRVRHPDRQEINVRVRLPDPQGKAQLKERPIA